MSVRALSVACLVATLAFSSSAFAQDKPNWRDGRKVFKRCESCHTFKAEEHRFGPSLSGFYGREAATAPNFTYSKGMQKRVAKGLVWTTETLNTFLKAPRKFVPGTRMSFPGLRSDKDRRNVIAYIKRRSKR